MDDRRLLTLGLWIALATAAVLSCSEPSGTEPGALGRGVYVPLEWKTARTVSGHHTHVVERAIPCVKCHELGADSMGQVAPARCAACHEKEAQLSHAAARASEKFGAGTKSDCTSCHAFTTDGLPSHPAPPPDGGPHVAFSASDCARCHREPQGGTPAVIVHGKSDCTQCHRAHDDAGPTPSDCAACHEEKATGHAPAGTAAVKECTTCHQHQHAPASEARQGCADCHAGQEPRVPATALFTEGHAECIGCHRPHTFGKESAVPCRNCHADVHVLGAGRVAEHRECTSCHSPHDVKGSPAAACARCHTNVHPDHPKKGVAGSCVGCHDAHPAGGHPNVRARECSGCHQAAASETAFHGGLACSRCHKPHDFALPHGERGLCRDCHGKQLAAATSIAGHQECEGCHRGLPHRPAALPQDCSACHAAVQAKVHRGHAECTKCHEPHGGTVNAPCGSCHREEERSAPAGHKSCTNCHDQHAGTAARAPCASCHAAEAKSPHGAIDGACATCHRAHGPEGVAKPPPCGQCHQPAKLPGLHSVARHTDCAGCHQGHDGARAVSPAECRACHTDRKNHFPDAPFCGSCHLFTKAP